MTPAPATPVPPLPSWRWPIALGALSTLVLHLPVLWENLLWVALCASFGVTGMFCGVLPAWIALRRDPQPTLGSGFAVSFIATGIGAVSLAVTTLLRGFSIPAEQEEAWRAEFLAREMKPEAIAEFFAQLRGGQGDSWTVLAAAFLAFGGGLAGATVAAIRARRTARKG